MAGRRQSKRLDTSSARLPLLGRVLRIAWILGSGVGPVDKSVCSCYAYQHGGEVCQSRSDPRLPYVPGRGCAGGRAADLL
jgi:hypothetical protein